MEKEAQESTSSSSSDCEEEEEESEESESEPEKKRPHLLNNNFSINTNNHSPMARLSSSSPHNNTSVDAAVLQYQNQKLVQQIDVQKHEIHGLETKIKELRGKQASYDSVLIAVNQLWNQLAGDLILLGVRAGAGQSSLKNFDDIDHLRGSVPPCSAEDMFLCRLLETTSLKCKKNDESNGYIKEALAFRHSSTRKLIKSLEHVLDAERAKIENFGQACHGKRSAEDAIIQLSKSDDLMKEEADKLKKVIHILHLKQKEYADAIESCCHNHSVDEAEIKRLAGELEESMAELEESRRKLVNLKMQKNGSSPVRTPVPVAEANGSVSPEKPADKTKRLRELKDTIEETKVLAEERLSELEDAQEDNLVLIKQLQDLQNELKEDKHIYSSRPYTLLHDQLQHWNAEAERFKGLVESLQADRVSYMRREKELISKAESVDAARKAMDLSESKIEELEHQLKKCIAEKNELEIKMEEVIQDSERKDVKAEFKVMSLALSKELSMMEAQVNRWKGTAEEAVSLRKEAQSLKALLEEKTSEQKNLADKCTNQMEEIKSLKALIEKMQKEKQELQIFLDMVCQQIYDNRDLMEINESDQRAIAQAEFLRNALEEHSLELRVKAANEAEAAYRQRLSAAEAEIAELRTELDANDRSRPMHKYVLELNEAIKVKEAESETYMSEIETIGQAYEDNMQTQNQHLLQQVTERDDYNIKLVSESVKTKQAQSLLVSEKQTLAKQLQHVNMSLESLKLKITQSEDQMKAHLMEALTYVPLDRHLALNLETTRWELSDAEKELKWLKSAVSSSDKEHEQIQRKLDEIQMELDTGRNERKKLDEEITELNRTIFEMTSESGEAAVQRLQDEVKECKAILKCGVCLDRPKEVVIVKCYHLFCNQCIQRNLEIRHRKCPGCGTAFGQSDVRFVKI